MAMMKVIDFVKATLRTSWKPAVQNGLTDDSGPTCKLDPEIPVILNESLQISSLGWALLTLNADPIFKRLKEEEWITTAQDALQCGISEAAQLKRSYSGRNVREIVDSMGIEVSYVTKNRFGSYLYFSQYYSKPPQIELFQTTLDQIDQVIAAAGLEDRFGGVNLQDALIAHELFHHLECTNPQIATRIYRVKTWRVAGYQAHSNLVSLGEIGAFAFAKELLGLPYFPRVLELAALYQKNKDTARGLLEKLKQWDAVAGES